MKTPATIAGALALFWTLTATSPAVPSSEQIHDPVAELVATATTYVGQTETHGANRSPIIDSMNRAVGAPLGSPYCASAVSWYLDKVGASVPQYRTAWSRAFVRSRGAVEAGQILRGEYSPRRGDVVVWKRSGAGGHIGIVTEDWHGATGRVSEANTSAPNASGSQWNGDGFWIRKRSINRLSAFRITHVIPVQFATGAGVHR